MNYEERIEELITQGYNEEEAIEIVKQEQEEEEHLAFFRFQEIYDRKG